MASASPDVPNLCAVVRLPSRKIEAQTPLDVSAFSQGPLPTSMNWASVATSRSASSACANLLATSFPTCMVASRDLCSAQLISIGRSPHAAWTPMRRPGGDTASAAMLITSITYSTSSLVPSSGHPRPLPSIQDSKSGVFGNESKLKTWQRAVISALPTARR